ncbi:MAG: CDP-alcohol phosphatidyltransferase family protein [Candidatus Helarchaeota archaeon]|nr:CDP-alcohol phosphatidyltransferase family protein [Candidatus Helarchaeota archaeon]
MSEFDIFNIIYLIAITALTVLFVVHTILTRKKFELKSITFDEYFRYWLIHHQVKTPAEEIRGPLRPYLKPFFVVGKLYARTGITANKLTILGLLWAFWALECWFLGGNWILLSVLFVILSGTTDSLDGVVALLTNTESKFGAWLDAVLDKFGDILWVAGPIYFLFVAARDAGVYDNFWLTLLTVVGLVGFLFAIIQEYCRARYEGLGLSQNIPVIGERISRLGFVIVMTACIGFSNVLTWLNPTLDFINVNIWMWTYIIPICFFGLLVFSILSIVQLTRHVQKNLK